MTKNKDYRKQLEGQCRALEEHLEKLARERSKSIEEQDQGLILHWEKTVSTVVSKSPNSNGGSTDDCFI
ncbi:MAG: hypothetical protein KME07_21680 [Pegethrix bostrychoides GSE-TBD4-15B]|jgi:frataxin-like iron-binding protein CyaY|uniref:Uncharacterized protein n=1 Tax=Pegethrix bostrychoides GSE-TBD4-15B TaxID=2839662 RepID=A0A951U6U5_9CYAN|nr:hypothetical protein [Pegethrix bostrychoides GSE-TBD4-15B]